MGRSLAATLAVVIVALVTAPLIVKAHETKQVMPQEATAASETRIGTSAMASAPMAAARDSTVLVAALQQLAAESGASVSVTVVELGGLDRLTWSLDGGAVFTAASTYKLVALMLEAQKIASGSTDPNGLVCYQDSDYEAGWFDDYAAGECFTRNELASRAGQQSDNTAGHMLVRDVGGVGALNAWAASVGATDSAFSDPNTTTATDLAVLWTAEANGSLGGASAQAWLYPLLTGTTTEAGVPAGVSASTVVHKTGAIDAVENDAALVTAGPDGAYVLVVMTDGLGGAAGWGLISSISATVWQTEQARLQ
jgi:beta-lactamase class A